MLTKFEKRLLAGVMSAMMCFSVVQIPVLNVHAEDSVVSEATAQKPELEEEVVATDQLDEESEGKMIPIPEKIEVDQPDAEKEIPVEESVMQESPVVEENTVQDITLGDYETVIAEENQEVKYRFVPEKTGTYCIQLNDNANATVQVGENYNYIYGYDGAQKFMNFNANEECFISIRYEGGPDEPTTGTVSWSISEAEIQEVSIGEKHEEVCDPDGWNPVYKFIPKQNGTYTIYSTEYLRMNIYDSNWNYVGENRKVLEAGQTYYLELEYFYNDLVWSIEKPEQMEIMEGETYTATVEKVVEYTFLPKESGKYQFNTDMDTNIVVYDEYGNRVFSGSDDVKFLLEKDTTYYINLTASDNTNWSIAKLEVVNVQENTEYTTSAGQAVEYFFTPRETGIYQFDSDISMSLNIYDENDNYINNISGISGSISLEKDRTYGVEIYNYFDQDVTWNVGLAERVNVHLDINYTTSARQKVCYQFEAPETGKYQLSFSEYMNFEIYDETWERVEGHYGNSAKVSLERGKTYYIDFSLDKEVVWSITKTRVIEVEEGTLYTTTVGQSVEYQFTPSESGRYEFCSDKAISGEMKNESGFWENWYGFNKYVSLEKGVTYSINFDSGKKVNWSIGKAELPKVQEQTEYHEVPELYVEYQFTPSETGKYQFSFDAAARFEIYNENWEYLQSGSDWWNSFNETVTLEGGATYYINIFSENEYNWNVTHIETTEIQLETEYTTKAGQAVDYQFVSQQSGRYQFCFNISTGVSVYDENGEYISSGIGLRRKVFLEEGKTYYIHFMDCEDVTWSVTKSEIQVIQEETEYTTKAGQAVDYQFIPKNTGDYILLFENIETCNVYDSNWQYAGGFPSKDNMVVSLTAGETYYFDLQPDGEEVTWKVEEVKVSGKYEYRIQNDNTVEILKYSGEEDTIAVPETFEGKTVTSIGSGAFGENQILKSITLPASVSELQYAAFLGCSTLQSVKFTAGSKLKTIEDMVFDGCVELNDIEIPSSVEKLGESAFDSTGLTQLIIPDSVTELGKNVFVRCEKLQSVHIGKGLTKISTCAFEGCVNLQRIELSQDIRLKSIENFAFGGCKKLDSFLIPDGVEKLGTSAFSGTALTQVVIPDSVTEVGDAVFSGCNSLQSVSLGKGVNRISEYMFGGCSQLTKIAFSGNTSIGSSVTDIEYAAFTGCSSLQDIQLPDSVKTISGFSLSGDRFHGSTLWYDNQDDGVVYNDKILYGYKGEMQENTDITVQDGTTVIASYAFYSQSGLKGIELPDGMTNIGAFAVFDCKNMQEITIPRSVTEIEPFAFGYVEGNPRDGVYYKVSGNMSGFAKKIDGFTIHGYPNSAAQRYAEENGFEFVPTVSIIKGDVNWDGNVDSADLRLTLRSVCGKEELTEDQKAAADVDGNGNGVDSQDMRKILRFVCGKIEEL